MRKKEPLEKCETCKEEMEKVAYDFDDKKSIWYCEKCDKIKRCTK